MEKILLAIEAANPDKNAIEFACYLARLTKSKITGIFLENIVAQHEFALKEIPGAPYREWHADERSSEYRTRAEAIEKNITLFKQKCTGEKITCRVHRDRGVPADELIEESRFADLVVVDAETSFNKRYEGSPTEFVKDILQKAECPVVIAPESFDGINEVVFTYNDSASSVFAIKQFTYLLPQLHEIKVSIIQVNESGKWEDRDKYIFSEWLKDHYGNLHFEALKGDTNTVLFDYLLRRKNIFLVMGAYGRNTLSQFFKHSRAELLIKGTSQPIFIAHH